MKTLEKAIYLEILKTRTWNPPPGKMGDNFIGRWGTLNFKIWISQMGGGLKIFHTFFFFFVGEIKDKVC